MASRIWSLRSWIAPFAPPPSRMMVSSLLMVTFLAVPSMVGSTLSRLRPTSSLITCRAAGAVKSSHENSELVLLSQILRWPGPSIAIPTMESYKSCESLSSYMPVCLTAVQQVACGSALRSLADENRHSRPAQSLPAATRGQGRVRASLRHEGSRPPPLLP